MTLPNRLTLSRFVLTPVFAVSFYLMRIFGSGAAAAVFAVACVLIYCYMEITDLADGKIARKRGLVTDLGKLFDPFADSVMHLTFFSLFVHFRLIGFIPFYLILFREVSILFIRMLSMKAGVVMPANAFGKFKTFFYAFLSFLVIAYASVSVFEDFPLEFARTAVFVFHALSYLAALFSVISLAVYFFSGVVKGGALSAISK